METRILGTGGPSVAAVGLGCDAMSGGHGHADDDLSISTIHAALDAGVNLLDTGDFYGMGHNEALIGRALKGRRREEAVLSVKFGGQRDPAGNFVGIDTRPSSVKASLAYSLQRLGVDHIDIYRPCRLDPAVPIEDTVGAIAEMVQAGWVRHIGLSEMGADTIRRAQSVHQICDLQIEWALFTRGVEGTILATCRELGIGITAYGVLVHGLLSGTYEVPDGGDPRGWLPRFGAANVGQNLALVEEVRKLAEARGLTVAQFAIAWVAAQGPDVVALVGARRPGRVPDAVAASEVTFTPDELAAIDQAVPYAKVAGTRYAAPLMALLDSER